MIDISILRAMVAAGAPVEAILAAVEADQLAEGARVQARRAKDAERQRRKRHADTAGQTVTPRDAVDGELALTSLLTSSENTQKEETVSKKERAQNPRKIELPDSWKPNAAHHAKAKKQGRPRSFVDQKADDMRNWAKAKGAKRVDWDAMFHQFLKPGELVNGHRPHAGARQSGGADFFAGLAAVAEDIDGQGGVAGPADPSIPVGRVNIDG